VADARSDRSAPSGGDLLADPSVRLYLATAGLSSLASFLLGTALAKQVYDVTGSALALGMLGLVEFLPAALLVPVTGSVADRFDRRRVVALGLIGEGICSVLLAWYAFSDPTSPTPIFLLAIGFGTFRAFVSPATRSLPPLIGPEGILPRLIALLSVTWQLGMIVGPASSGFLYDVDTALPYLSAAALFAAGAVGFAAAPGPATPHWPTSAPVPSHGGPAPGAQPECRSSPRPIRSALRRRLRLAPSIAEDRLGVGNIGYGWLRAAPGSGPSSSPPPVAPAATAHRQSPAHRGRSFWVATVASASPPATWWRSPR
jgi:MFS family permease